MPIAAHSVVIAGLDPAAHLFRKEMDASELGCIRVPQYWCAYLENRICDIKSGHDE
jgi:hypothetical protein